MDVVMFMVEALQDFEKKSEDEIKKIAMEIALLGTQGYNPEKKGYKIDSIEEKKFSGYQILAYYYVSWALVLTEMLPQLKLPYEEEYSLAKTLYNKGPQ
jgi:hypothetical protein